MKVLFAAAEETPFVKTGGLADVIGALPAQLKKSDCDVKVILPLYREIPPELKEKMSYIDGLVVPLAWRRQFTGLKKLIHNGIEHYFIENEYYFDRKGIYGYPDDGERFAFFCRAVLESLPFLNFKPDIIHLHDWHTALISTFLKADYQKKLFYKDIKTVFTIHNLQYQGIFPAAYLEDILSLDHSYFTQEGLEFYGQLNYLKGGLNFSQKITTVSNSYAEEIQKPLYGENLDGVLRKRCQDLTGIINGIDYDIYNPSSDPLIYKKYDVNDLENKYENKIKLQQELKLKPDGSKEIPLIGFISRLVSQKGLDLLIKILDDMMKLDLQLVVLGTGESRYEGLLRKKALTYPEKLSVNIKFDNKLAHRIYAASDLFLMPSLFEPCGLGQLIAMRYGSIPVVRETGGLKDTVSPVSLTDSKTNPVQGNGFTFQGLNPYSLLEQLTYTLHLFQKKEIWKNIMKKAMRSDYSWKQSAQRYIDLYNELSVLID